ncbi:hypothetical protein GCM10022247_42060 [Allokutzneria multivorans]|uniref:SCP1.201-like deaminase n=1 Tax=Allokutzneria multivorans TaxID=1142134 RepID=A0ABP7SPR2_9PSEU
MAFTLACVAARLLAARSSLAPESLRALAERIGYDVWLPLGHASQSTESFALHDALGLLRSVMDELADAAERLDSAADSRSIPHPSTLSRETMRTTLDPAWARRQQTKLADRPGGKGPTTGLVFFGGGEHEDEVITSGEPPRPQPGEIDPPEHRARRELIDAAELILVNSEHFPSPPRLGRPDVRWHAETQTATLMRLRGITHGTIVINNTRVCPGVAGCRFAVAAILPEGYTLAVWERGADEPVVIQGKARP